MARLPDSDRVAAVIAEVAAEVILPRFRALHHGDISEKTSPSDLVTIADVEAEQRLTPLLSALAPGSVVVGEEATSAKPELIEAVKGEGPVWLVDPVDGTLNFAAGLALFAVQVAFVVGGETLACWIHDPVRGITAMAERGAGAVLRGEPEGERRLKVAQPASLAHMAGSPNFRFAEPALAERVAGRLRRLGSLLMLRASAQEYLAMAEGRMHFAVYHRLYPWDHAPGTLLVEEAGGIARHVDGSRYRAADPPFGSGLIVTPNEESWRWLRDALFVD